MELDKQLKYVDSLDKNTKENLTWYTSGEYLTFNEYLRDREELPDKVVDDYEKVLKSIDEAFRKAPQIKDSLTVYRGVEEEGYILNNESFISTSLEQKVAKEFAKCCLLKITLSSGCKVLPLYSISEHKDEKEILIDRDSMFILTKKDTFTSIKIFEITVVPKTSVSIIDEPIEILEKKIDYNQVENAILEFYEDDDEEDIDEEDIRIQYSEYIKRHKLVLNPDISNKILVSIITKLIK